MLRAGFEPAAQRSGAPSPDAARNLRSGCPRFRQVVRACRTSTGRRRMLDSGRVGQGRDQVAGSQDFQEDPRNAAVLALADGALVPLQQATVSIFDAGFGLGDGVWEGLRLHRGSLLFLDDHLERLYAGAAAIAIDVGLGRDELRGELRRLLAANGMEDGAHLRLMVT